MFFKNPPSEIKNPTTTSPTEGAYKNTIPSATHWANMQTRLNQFKAVEIKPSNEEDEFLYQKLYIKYVEKIKNGLASEEYNFFCKPFLAGMAWSSDSLECSKEGSDFFRTLSHPYGIKSLAFLELVILPYLMDSQQVRYTSAYSGVQKMIDFFSSPGSYIYTGHVLYSFRADQLKEALDYFKKNNPSVAELLPEIARRILPVTDVNATNISNNM